MRIAALLTTFIIGLALAPVTVQAKTGFAENVVLAEPGLTVPHEELRYADGRTGTLKDYEGEVLVVTLWQEHCPFCHREMPVLDRLSRDMKTEGVRVVALGLDQEMSLITGFLDNLNLNNIEPIMDYEKVNGSLFSIEHFGRFSIATPTSFIVDKKGNVVARIWGLIDWDGDAARAFLRSLVNQT